jgi:hypothetical protein
VLADPGPLLRGVYLPASSLLFCAATLTDVVTRKQLLMDRMICEQVGDMGHQLHLESLYVFVTRRQVGSALLRGQQI